MMCACVCVCVCMCVCVCVCNCVCVCVCVCLCVCVGSCLATSFYRQFAGYGKGVGHRIKSRPVMNRGQIGYMTLIGVHSTVTIHLVHVHACMFKLTSESFIIGACSH